MGSDTQGVLDQLIKDNLEKINSSQSSFLEIKDQSSSSKSIYRS
jgi:hypothetical protein